MIIDFKTLQKDFNSRSSELKNTKRFVEDELKQVDLLLNHSNYAPDFGMSGLTERYKSKLENLNRIYNCVQSGWKIFLWGYEKYYYNEKETKYRRVSNINDISEKHLKSFNDENEVFHNQGLELGKYVLWLRKLENEPSTEKEYSTLSPEQKLLALHYLGLDFRDFTNTHVANVLSQILNVGP
ncbi:hypothetical protein N7U66_12210 [Lacinutrix neustonica]|uniref:Uncharacterized protein n=1 Tax=Lacinutrix neustonica TaxID=2980107 RepID=A0A9E8MT33_9FLAO|nr:hypothetical protein [Lacinutrix neustonica]WAC00967.1 hypothetical protein N7U66_12210 [Lacinutrix neustonica]